MASGSPGPGTSAPAGGGDPAESTASRQIVGPWALAILLVLVGLQSLSKEMWYDEAYTILCYVLPGARFSLTHLAVPNNHVLYSVLLSPLARWNLEPLYRLPSLVAAALVVWLTCRALRGAATIPAQLRWTLVLSVYAAFPAFLSLATQIRGYSLAMALIAACLALLAPQPGEQTLPRRCAYALAGAAAVATVATSVLPLAALALFDLGRAAARGRGGWRALAWTAAPHAAALAGLTAYVPTWRDFLTNARRGWGMSGWPLASEILLALAVPFAVLAAAALLWGRVQVAGPRLREPGDLALLGLATATVCASILLLGVRLYPRSFSGFIPLAVASTVGVVSRVLAARPRVLLAAALTTAVLGQSYWQLGTGVGLRDGRAHVPRVLLPAQFEARDFDPSEAVTAALAGRRPGDPVFVDNRDAYCDEMALYYYAAMAGSERAIVFAPRGLPRRPPSGDLQGAAVVSRDLEGRDAIAEALGLRPAGWQVLKGSGHFKVWRIVGGPA